MAINHIGVGVSAEDGANVPNATIFLKNKQRPQLKEFLVRLHRFLDSVRVGEHRHPLRCLDFGCGPSVWSALSLARIADEIVFAEYATSNRKEIYKWLKKEPDCRDWLVASAIVADLERSTARAVEDRLRAKLCSVVPCDIHAECIIQRSRKGSQSLCYYTGGLDELRRRASSSSSELAESGSRRPSRSLSDEVPLTPESPRSRSGSSGGGADESWPPCFDEDIFDIVLSTCCLECACTDEQSYRRAVEKLAARTASGGYLVLEGIMDCPTCGPGWRFPRLELTETIVRESMRAAGLVLQVFETFNVPGIQNVVFYLVVARKKCFLTVATACRETQL